MSDSNSIGDFDELFVRVFHQMVNRKTGNPAPAAFYNTPKTGFDLSSDWSKYHTAEQSRALIGKQYKFNTTTFKNPNDFFITSLVNKDIYGLNCGQSTAYTPKIQNPEPIGDPNNYAHASIYGDKTEEEIRLKFVGISKWAIPPNS